MTDEQQAHGAEGNLEDGTPFYPASQQKLNTYLDASQALSKFESPVMVHTNRPDERLFIAAFDGTGNDKFKDPSHATNVAKIVDAITVVNDKGNQQIRVGYVPGPGTQDPGVARTLDGITGGSYNQRTEEMYKLFIKQAAEWKTENPNMRISVADIGFSRGAEQAAGFARLVHERGIQDPDGAKYSYGANGLISRVTYDKPPIVAPGETAQSVGLFDPVGTGKPIWLEDRRLPPSVISGFQIIAGDERRGLFKSDHIIKPGRTPDGRFLGVTVAGSHSDIGGSYHLDGLSVRSNNLMVDYLNSLRDLPYLEKTAEPTTQALNVIHRSDESNVLYKYAPKVDRLKPEGFNELLTPRFHFSRIQGDHNNAEPRDDIVSQRFTRHEVPIAEVPLFFSHSGAAVPGNLSSQLNRLLAAGSSGDQAAMRAGTQALANNDAARTMQSEAVATVNRQEQTAIPPQIMAQKPSQQAPAPPQHSLGGPQR